MDNIPFLKPKTVPKEDLTKYLAKIDQLRIYSNYGPLNQEFEGKILQEYFYGDGACVTVNNATIGLILAIAQVKRQGKYALMPSFTFSATPLAAQWCGLTPYYIDISPDDWCLDESQLEEVIQKLGDEVAVVIPYAAFGIQMNLNYYESLLQRRIPVVIDAASSFGSTKDAQFGKGFGGTVVFSFHATKSFGIGEGGLVYSGNPDVITGIRQAANFGFSEQRETRQTGLNGKISEYTAAVGLATLNIFDQKIKIREEIRQWYLEAFQAADLFNSGWKMQFTGEQTVYQFFPLLCPPRKNNQYYVNFLQDAGIQVRTYFSPPCHKQAAFYDHPYISLTVTEEISNRILSLPVWEDMEQHQVQRIVRCLANG